MINGSYEILMMRRHRFGAAYLLAALAT